MAADGVYIDGIDFEQSHGKARVRVARVWKDACGQQHFVEWSVNITLLSGIVRSYTSADNSEVVATDTMKNTVYVKAKECVEQVSAEEFAILLAKHFTSFYKQVTDAIVKVVEKPWERVLILGEPHNHGFKLGSEKRITEVIVKNNGDLQMTSGIEGLSVLKTTQSGFEGFVNDKYTSLPKTRQRMLATEVSASWRYPYSSLSDVPSKPFYFTERYLDIKQSLIETFFGSAKEGVYSPSVESTLLQMARNVLNRFPDVASIKLTMPNIHFHPVNISSKDHHIVKFDNDVYLPTDEPYGKIEASLSRSHSKL